MAADKAPNDTLPSGFPETAAAADARDKDDALAMVGEEWHAVDAAVEARALRKLDWFLVPAMVVGYGLVYYDKAILGFAVLFGMVDDLELSVVDASTTPPTVDTRRLSWANSLFYLGMLAGLYPMSFALQRVDMDRILGVIVVVWSAVCMLTAAVKSWQGLYAQRFALGFVESIVPTGFTCIVSACYTQAEQSLRQSWWFSSAGLFSIIGGGLSYGFSQIGDRAALRPWQSIYLLSGSLTFIFGCACFAMPSSPISAWFLTSQEKLAAVERLRHGQTGVRCTRLKWPQLREAALDAKVWLVALMMASTFTVNDAVSGFRPLIVSTFGWSSLASVLLQFPLGALSFSLTLATGYFGSRFRNIRILMIVLTCLPVIAGCAIMWKSEWSYHAAAPVIGYSMTGCFGATAGLVISVGMSNVAGHTKKSFMSATTFVAYCVGNIVGPQLIWSQTKEDHYPALWLGLIICYTICIAAALALYLVLYHANRKKMACLENESERAKLAFRDLTDKENPYFRYVY